MDSPVWETCTVFVSNKILKLLHDLELIIPSVKLFGASSNSIRCHSIFGNNFGIVSPSVR